MRIAKHDLPVAFEAPGAKARQSRSFGNAKGYSEMAGEYFSMAAGTDIAPMLKGLEDDLCQSPHWGYLIEGEVRVDYKDGTQETVAEGELFYWPPGHTVKVEADAEIILFSPVHEHCKVLDHFKDQAAS